VRVRLATSNAGKLREYRRLTPDSTLALDLLPAFSDFPIFDESAPTFAENAAGKALHYSRFSDDFVLADDSGLVVPALGGEPGVRSARYAGEHAGDPERNAKLLSAMRDKSAAERSAHFVCVVALARAQTAIAVVSDRVDGLLTEDPRGASGFGYDPIFFVPELGRTFAEAGAEEKDRLSHRAKAFRKLLAWIAERDFAQRKPAFPGP
jgi:XTP/dITP diphosphohydrolase